MTSGLMKPRVLAAIATLAAAAVTLIVTIAAWVITIGWLKLIVLFVLIQL